jgi:vesicle-fusing ATPase
MVLLTGDNEKQQDNTFGRLLGETQVQLRTPEGSLIILQQSSNN